MNFRFTAFLFLAVLALVVALLVLNLTDAPPRPDAGLLEPLAGIKAADLDTVEVASPTAETLVFARTAGKWELKQPVAAKIDTALVEDLVRDLYDAKPTPFKDLTTNLKVHGLENPVRITLKKGDAAATVGVGNTTIGGAASAVTFVLPADRPNTPVAVRTSTLRSLFRDATFGKDGSALDLTKRLTDFRQVRLLSFNAAGQGSDIAALKVSKGTAAFALQRTGDGNWNFTWPQNYGEADIPGDTKPNADYLTGVQPLLTALDAFRPAARTDYIEGVPAANLGKYGLAADDPNVIRVDLWPKAGPPETLFIGKAVEASGVPAVPAKVYCRLDGDTAIVPVPTDRAKLLANTAVNPSPMRNRDLIPATRKPRIDALDVTVGATTLRLRKVGLEPAVKWFVFGGPSDPTEVTKAVVDDLVSALCAPRAAAEVLNAPSQTAFVPAEVKGSVKVYFDGIAKAEPIPTDKPPLEPIVAAKDSAPPVALTFGQTTPTGVHARRAIGTAEPTDFILPLAPREGEKATLYALASRPRLEYLNPNVGSFNPDVIQRVYAMAGPTPLYDLSLTEADKLTVEEKQLFPGGKWSNWTLPGAGAAAKAIGFALAGLDQSKPVAESPPDADLKAWGLLPARLEVHVFLKSEPGQERVYYFGNEIPGTGTCYLQLARDGKKSLMVVAAAKALADTAEKADARDPVVHRIARAAITQVDFSWKAETGQTDTLSITPDAKTKWAVKEPAGFNLNADAAELLVKLIEVPSFGGTLVPGWEKPEYKLTGDAMKVTISHGKEKPTEFIVGAKDETGQNVYAKSSGSPNTVVKLPAAAFEKYLKDGRKSLGK